MTPMYGFEDPTQINIFLRELRAQTKSLKYLIKGIKMREKRLKLVTTRVRRYEEKYVIC